MPVKDFSSKFECRKMIPKTWAIKYYLLFGITIGLAHRRKGFNHDYGMFLLIHITCIEAFSSGEVLTNIILYLKFELSELKKAQFVPREQEIYC